MGEGLRDWAADLLLGSSCVGCARPGRLLCPACAADLPAAPFPAWPDPVPGGLAEPWAAAAYEGTIRAMVLGLKERHLLALAEPLSRLLAAAVAAELPVAGPPLVLVPVPSRRATVRARGHDPTRTVTTRAAALLRRAGRPATVARPLRLRRAVRDQAGLGAAERSLNLAGSMGCAPRVARRLVGARLVVCDDVLTTGSTAHEAQRALEAAGLLVVRLAVVAATPRRRPVHRENSAVRLPSSGGSV